MCVCVCVFSPQTTGGIRDITERGVRLHELWEHTHTLFLFGCLVVDTASVRNNFSSGQVSVTSGTHTFNINILTTAVPRDTESVKYLPMHTLKLTCTLVILIVKVTLNVHFFLWYSYVLCISARHLNVAGLVNMESVYILRGLPIVCWTHISFAYCSGLVADKWVFVMYHLEPNRAAVQLLHQNTEKVHSRKETLSRGWCIYILLLASKRERASLCSPPTVSISLFYKFAQTMLYRE